MSFNKKNIIYIIVFVIILLGGLLYRFVLKGIAFNTNEEDFITSPSISSDEMVYETTDISLESDIVSETIAFRVYICGEVINPGVYDVQDGLLLCDVIELAGGLTDKAPISNINLVYEIKGNISIYIPTIEEISEFNSNTDLVRENIIFVWGENVSDLDVAEEGDMDIVSSSNLVNINTASKEELMTLPGIGEATAESIIAYRSVNLFNSKEDLKNVSGIGDAKYSKVEEYICVK